LLLSLAPGSAWAHGGNPAEAKLTAPPSLGVVADEQFTITWLDLDTPIPTGTATVNLYYAARMPPTFFLGVIPETLTGTAIATGIPEYQTPNRFEWDLSAVPSGTYWIWSRVDDPPEPIPSPIYLSFSPAPLAVQHPGDGIGPSVRVIRPNVELSYSNEGYEITWESFAPNGPASVRIEAGRSVDGSDFMLLAERTETSTSFYWDTREVEQGDWTIRAVITDQTGSFTAYARFYLLVTHFFPQRDAGVLDSGGSTPQDAAVHADASGPGPMIDEDCGCSTARTGDGVLFWPWWILSAAAVFRSGCRTSSATIRRKRA
jgi:hypothetical protein